MKKLFYSLFALAMTAMTFISCEDVPAPYDDPNNNPGGAVIDPAGQGTQDDPFNVIAAINYAKNLEMGAESPQVYIKGIVVSFAENYTTQYGNAQFYISDDGTARNQFLIYRALYLGNKKYNNEEDAVLVEGDTVIICGVITNYNGTIETQQNKAFLYSLNGKSEGGGGSSAETIGTADAPITTAKALELINALADGGKSTEKAYVKGKIVKVATTEENFAKYGNINYYISDDGSSANQVQVYAGDGLNGEKFKSVSDIKAGDEVVVFGVLYKYVNKSNTVIPEITDSYLVKLVEGSGGGGGESGEIKTVTIAEFNAASESTSVWYKISGTVKNLKDGDLYGNFDLEDNTGSVYVYGLLSEKGGEKKQFQTLASEKGIKNGVKITIIGNRGSYNDKIEVTNAYFVSVDGEGGGSGESGEIKTVTIAEFNAASESTSVWYKLSGTVKNLKDGDQYGNFDLEDNTGSVYVYGLLSEKGGEKKQFQTLASEKGIKNGVKITIIGNRGSYNDKIEVTNAYFVSVDGEGGGGGEQPSGAGSYDSPLTVSQAVALGEADAAWVKGYIVGYVEGQVLSSGAKFEAGGSVNTNILIAASASEKDVNNCMPIQLSRDYRADFALDANSDMLGKQVIVAGQLTKYFGVAGIKYPTYMEANGKSVGNKVRYRKR